jgi:hypothetical protein
MCGFEGHYMLSADVNTMGVVEHERIKFKRTSLTFSDFSSALQLPKCLYHSI